MAPVAPGTRHETAELNTDSSFRAVGEADIAKTPTSKPGSRNRRTQARGIRSNSANSDLNDAIDTIAMGTSLDAELDGTPRASSASSAHTPTRDDSVRAGSPVSSGGSSSRKASEGPSNSRTSASKKPPAPARGPAPLRKSASNLADAPVSPGPSVDWQSAIDSIAKDGTSEEAENAAWVEATDVSLAGSDTADESVAASLVIDRSATSLASKKSDLEGLDELDDLVRGAASAKGDALSSSRKRRSPTQAAGSRDRSSSSRERTSSTDTDGKVSPGLGGKTTEGAVASSKENGDVLNHEPTTMSGKKKYVGAAALFVAGTMTGGLAFATVGVGGGLAYIHHREGSQRRKHRQASADSVIADKKEAEAELEEKATTEESRAVVEEGDEDDGELDDTRFADDTFIDDEAENEDRQIGGGGAHIKGSSEEALGGENRRVPGNPIARLPSDLDHLERPSARRDSRTSSAASTEPRDPLLRDDLNDGEEGQPLPPPPPLPPTRDDASVYSSGGSSSSSNNSGGVRRGSADEGWGYSGSGGSGSGSGGSGDAGSFAALTPRSAQRRRAVDFVASTAPIEALFDPEGKSPRLNIRKGAGATPRGRPPSFHSSSSNESSSSSSSSRSGSSSNLLSEVSTAVSAAASTPPAQKEGATPQPPSTTAAAAAATPPLAYPASPAVRPPRPVIVEMPYRSPAEEAAVATLKERLRAKDLLKALHPHMQVAAETEDGYLVRFLRARKNNVDAAEAMVLANHEWRVKEGVNELANLTAQEVLGCEIDDIWEWAPNWMQGEDMEGRPVIYKEWSNFWFKEIAKHTTTHQMLRYHIWLQEMGARALGHQSLKYGRRIDKFTCVMEAKTFNSAMMRNGAMPFVKGITAVDQAHYPERLNAILIFNAPRMMSTVWSIIRRWLDSVTRDKVSIMSSEKEWRPKLESMVGPDYLPDIYGGVIPVQRPTGAPLPLQSTFSPTKDGE